MNAFHYDANLIITKVMNSSLPKRHKEKLMQDLTYLSSLEELPIEAIILFGSCARNDLKATSDIDLLIISQAPLDARLKANIRSYLAEPLNEVSTDMVFYLLKTFDESDSLFTTNIKQDGKILWRYTIEK